MHPDLVLLDLGMPPPDGYQVCQRLREEPWARDLCVVALTGWGQHRDRQRTARAGFDDHLVKPVERSQLEKLLATCAARRRPARMDPLQPIG
jgi:CheY-like chemotaxis protein